MDIEQDLKKVQNQLHTFRKKIIYCKDFLLFTEMIYLN